MSRLLNNHRSPNDTYAARAVLEQAKGPSWDVLKGRLDGRVSRASDVAGNLPDVKMTVDQLTAIFAAKGLSQKDMVALSGKSHATKRDSLLGLFL